jgi:DivIVA domain-containing protein
MQGVANGVPAPRFAVVRRGYDPAEVDRFVQDAAAGGAGEVPRFAVVRRGYDCAQVDAYVAALRGQAAEERSRPPDDPGRG